MIFNNGKSKILQKYIDLSQSLSTTASNSQFHQHQLHSYKIKDS